jgi:hypothetical protein
VPSEESDCGASFVTRFFPLWFFVPFLQQKSRGRCKCWISTNYPSQKIETPSSARVAEAFLDDVDLAGMQNRSHEKVTMKIEGEYERFTFVFSV